METEWKVPAVVSGVAFFIAILTGIIAGVGFGAVLLRAIVGGIAFGALSFGADALARKYLPELFVSRAATGEREEAESDDTSEESGGSTVDITIDEENPHVRDATPRSTEGSADEVDEFGPADESESQESVGELEAVDDADVPDVESEDGALPSFDSVESSFQSEGAGNDDTPGDSETFSTGRSGGIDVMGQEEDPATVARAVRTLLKRDEEG